MDLLNQDVLAALLSIITTVVGGYIGVRIQPRVILRWSATHAFHFFLDDLNPPLNLVTKTIVIENGGRQAAKNVEIVHSFRPEHFKLFPPTEYEESHTPDNSHIIRIPVLRPKDNVALELLHTATPPFLVTVRSDETVGREIRTQYQRVFPKWINGLAGIFAIIGLTFALFWFYQALLFGLQLLAVS